MSTHEKGDTIEIPITFTDPATGTEVSGVTDGEVTIYKGNTQIVPSTSLTLISGGRFTFSYAIPLIAASGIYTAYFTATVLGNVQTATYDFSVTDRLTTVQTTVDAIQFNLQSDKLDLDSQFSDLRQDLGDPSSDGVTIHGEIQNILSDIGNPLLTGQNITQKLDDIRTVMGLGTPVGIVTVTGTVIDDNSVPLQGVRAVAILKSTGLASDTAISDALGVYVLHLNPGEYIIQFIQATTVLRQTLDLIVPTLITTLTVPNVKLATKRTVTDVVQDPLGVAVPNVLVKAMLKANFDTNSENARVEAAAYTDTNGVFSIELFPGLYIFEYVKLNFLTLPQEVTVV